MKSHKSLLHFQENKAPVLLKNVIIKENNEWIFNEQSVAHEAASSNVTFEHVQQEKPAELSNAPAPTTVTVAQMKEVKPNQQ